MNKTTQSFKKQLPKNMVMSIFTLLSYASVTIFLTPYLVRNMGVAAFGLIALAAILTQYVGVISNCLSGAISRFISVELNKQDGNALSVFNSALALCACLAIIQSGGFYYVISHVRSIFMVPEALLKDVRILLFCSAISFCLSFVTGVFNVSTYAKNRIDISSWISTVAIILRVILIVTLFSLYEPKLRYIGYVELFLAFFRMFAGVVTWKKLTPELYLSLKSIDLKRLKPIFSMSIWVLVTQLGVLLTTRTDVWVVNKFISAEDAGLYAAVLQISYLIRQVTNVAFGLTGPMFIIYYAKLQMENVKRLCFFAVRLSSMGLAVLAAIVCAFSADILKLWLGGEYITAWPILCIGVTTLFLALSMFPFFQIQTAANKVRIPGIVTLIFGLLNVAIAIVAVRNFDAELLGVAIVSSFTLLLKNIVFMPIYTAKVLDFNILPVYVDLFKAIGIYIGVLLLGLGVKFFTPIEHLLSLVFAVGFVGLNGVIICWIILNRSERSLILGAFSFELGRAR